MSKICKIICSLFVVLVMTMAISVNAVTIKETTNTNDDFDTIADGTFVIGITKFEPDVIITALRATTATYNDVMFNYNKNDYDGVGVYYYTSGYWFQFDEQNNAVNIPQDDPLYDKLNNSDIYYVNNVEKIIDVPYNANLPEGSELTFGTDNGKLCTYENGVIHVPATVQTVYIYEKDSNEVETIIGVLNKENENDDTFVPTTIVNLTSSFEEKTNTLISTYYNKYNSETLTSVNDDVFYVNLGEYNGETYPLQLVIGEEIYPVDEEGYVGVSRSMSIGNNAFTNVPVWKIVDGNVLVAIPWISTDVMPGKDATITVGGQTFVVGVYGNSTVVNTLSITSVEGLFNPDGYTSNAEFSNENKTVDFYYTHGTQAVGVKLSADDEAITAANQVIFLKGTDGTMAMTTTEYGNTFVLYFKYADAPIMTETEYQRIYKIAVPGKGVTNLTLNGHARVKSYDITAEVETKTNSIISTYYNQYNSETLTNVNEDIYYVNIGEYVGSENPTSITIGESSYPVSETANVGVSYTLSIGNNAFINAPVWKIVNGNLYVAVTWLSAEAIPKQETVINVGGQSFRLYIYETDTTNNEVVLTNAVGLYNPAGYTSSVEFSNANGTVDFYYTHGTQAVGVTLVAGGQSTTAADQVILLKENNGKMAITTPEDRYTTFALYFHYEDAPITEAAEYQRIYKIAIPGKGTINLTFNGHAMSRSIDLSGVINTKSASLMETYYNQYNNETLTEVNDDIYYINLGKYLGTQNPTSLAVGNESYSVSGINNIGESLSLDIGGNSSITAPVWKIVDGNVYVALTWLCAGALPGQATVITIGGQQFAVNVYETTIANNALSLTDASGLFGPSGYGTQVALSKNTVDFYYTHRAQALGLKLSLGDELLVAENQIVLYEEVNGNMAIASTTEGYTMTVYFNYANEPVTQTTNSQKLYKIAIPGKGVTTLTLNGHAVSQNVVLTGTINKISSNIVDAYYKQYTQIINASNVLDESTYYVNLGKYMGTANPTSLTIGNESYTGTANVGESLSLDVGNNSSIVAPVWKIANGNVLVALPWLSVDTMPSQSTVVTVGGQIFNVSVFETDTSNNALSLTAAGGVYGPIGYETRATTFKNTVDFYYTHGTQGLGIRLSLGNEEIIEPGTIAFYKETNGEMVVTTAEDDYTFFVYFNYEDAPITEPTVYNKSYKVALPGIGVTNVSLTAHAVTEIPQQ